MGTFKLWGIGLVVVFAAGCDEHEHGAEPGDDACEHLEGGPVVPVTAGTSESAPLLASSHTRYDIALGAERTVKVPIGEAAEYYFFFASTVSLVVKDADGAVVVAEAAGSSDEHCDLVGAWFTYDLGVGTYTLEVTAPGEATGAQLVYFEAGGHEH